MRLPLLFAGDHGNNEVFSLPITADQHPGNMREHHRQHSVGSVLVQRFQPIAAYFFVNRPAGNPADDTQQQQQKNGDRAHRIMADGIFRLSPGQSGEIADDVSGTAHKFGEAGITRTGSSPRVWGTRLSAAPLYHCARFIPTGVGNAGLNMIPLPTNTVHPHGCGERRPLCHPRCNPRGSSPRV